MKTLAEIEKALQERYNGNTYEKNGNTYAAWEDIVYAANRIFGPLGWSREFTVNPYKLDDGFACVMRVTVYFLDEKGNPDSIGCEAPGYNELSYTKGWTDNDGKRHDPQPMTDTAFKGCYADALKKCLQAFGDAFALYIGAEAKAAKAASKGYSSTPRQDTTARANNANSGNASNGKGRPTEKQLNTLRKAGCPEGELEGISFEDASTMIGKIAGNNWKWDDSFGGSPTTQAKPAPKAAAKAPIAADSTSDDDFPF